MTPGGVALVTGAGSGIGRAAATALAAAGWRLCLAGRRLETLKSTADLCGPGAAPLCVVADVSDPASVDALFTTLTARFGRLDLLFNNAGAGAPPVSLEAVSFADWRRTLDVNVTGAFLCTQAAFRLMKSQQPRGGRIINNGSISATTPRPRSAPYTASKHALTGLTKSAALDGRTFDIACGQIDIGNAETPMTQRLREGALQPSGALAPEPLMDVEVVGRTLVYMAGLPLDANALFVTVMATQMPFVGRG
jgi:NAD(P)-dependent dehydrogenase (short-subunit alcohol dehydrogenase family)